MEILQLYKLVLGTVAASTLMSYYVAAWEKTSTLLLVHSGTDVSPADLWNGTSVTNYTMGSMQYLHSFIGSAINYRGEEIDTWNINPPVVVRMSFLNDFYDELFAIEFDSYNTSNNIEEWHSVTRILYSSLHISKNDVEITSPDFYDGLLKDTTTNYTWYAVLNKPPSGDAGDYPKFIFSGNATNPLPLKTEFTKVEYVGCYSYTGNTVYTMATMMKSQCIDECASTNANVDVVLFGFPAGSCACGFIADKVVENPHQCNVCPDNSIYECGIVSGLYGVYLMKGSSTLMNEWDPRQNLTYKIHDVFTLSIQEYSEYLINVTNSGYIYVVGFRLVSLSSGIVLYHIEYCADSCNRTMFHDLNLHNQRLNFTSNTTYMVSVLPVHRILLIISDIFTSENSSAVTLEVFTINGTQFVEAPILVIEGIWEDQTTFTEQQTTLTTIITEPSTVSSVQNTLESNVSITDTSWKTTGPTKQTTISTEFAKTTSEQTTEINTPTAYTSKQTVSATQQATLTEEFTSFTALPTEGSSPIIPDTTNYVKSTSQTNFDMSSTMSLIYSVISSTSHIPTSTTPETTSSLELTTSKTSSVTSKTTCRNCTCNVVIDMNQEISPEVKQRLEEVKKNLTVSKRSLSSYTRLKTSAADSRPSSAGIGGISIIIIVLVMSIVVVFDTITYLPFIKSAMFRLKTYLSI